MVDQTSDGNEFNSDTTVSLNLCGASVALCDDDDSENDNHSGVSDNSHSLQLSNNVLPPNTSLNVENSSDVIVGPVTQFHGPVTIYQNTHNNAPIQCDTPSYLSNGSLAENSVSSAATAFSLAKLVAPESLPGKPTGSAPFSKRKITIISILVFVIIVLLTVIISYVVGIYINQEKYKEVTPLINDFNLTERTPGEQQYPPQIPNSPHKIIYRSRWGGRPPLFERPQKVPVKYVIISHTAGTECFNLIDCSKQMQHAQSIHVDGGSPDIGYNFAIGGDANIYVGRGWDNHNFHMNLDTIGISFIGNYVYNTLSVPMVKATQELLKQGIELGKLTKNYTLVAHNQTWNTQSPGTNVYNQIKYWPHFSPDLLTDIPDI